MKKLLLLTVFLVAFVTSSNAQFNSSLALTGAIPTGDVKNQSSFALSADLYFLKDINSALLLGVTSGYTIYFGKEFNNGIATIDGPNFSYLPLAGAVRFKLSEDFSFGSDLGYAFGLSDNVNGGFYYKPTVGFNLGNNNQLQLSYQGISEDGFTANYVGIGFAFGM